MKNNLTLVELHMILVVIGILLMAVIPVKNINVEPSKSNSQMYIVQVTKQPESEVNVE